MSWIIVEPEDKDYHCRYCITPYVEGAGMFRSQLLEKYPPRKVKQERELTEAWYCDAHTEVILKNAAQESGRVFLEETLPDEVKAMAEPPEPEGAEDESKDDQG